MRMLYAIGIEIGVYLITSIFVQVDENKHAYTLAQNI